MSYQIHVESEDFKDIVARVAEFMGICSESQMTAEEAAAGIEHVFTTLRKADWFEEFRAEMLRAAEGQHFIPKTEGADGA